MKSEKFELLLQMGDHPNGWYLRFFTFSSTLEKTFLTFLWSLFTLICWAVFVFIFIFEHGEVGVVAAFGDVVAFNSLTHGAVGLVGVGAVVEAAVG